jgi:hypothetical protein
MAGTYWNSDPFRGGTALTVFTTPATSVYGEWVQVTFPVPTVANVYTLTSTAQPYAWVVGGSVNGTTNWEILNQVSNLYFSTQNSFSFSLTNVTHTGYLSYRVIIQEVGNSACGSSSEFTLLSASGNKLYPALVTSPQTLTKPIVPTSVAGAFTVSAFDGSSSVGALFDFDVSTVYRSDSNFTQSGYIGSGSTQTSDGTVYYGTWFDVVLPYATTITKYSIRTSGYTNKCPTSWNLLGSVDGASFSLVDTRTNYFTQYPSANTSYMFSISPQTLIRVRFVASATFNSPQMELSDFNIYNSFGRIIPVAVSPTTDVTQTFNTADGTAIHMYGGLYASNTSTIVTNPSLTVYGEWVQLTFPGAPQGIRYIRLTGTSLPVSCVVCSNVLPGSTMSNVIAQVSNSYDVNGTLVIPISTVPQQSTVFRIIGTELQPNVTGLGTMRISTVEFLDTFMNRLNMYFDATTNYEINSSQLGTSAIGNRTILGGRYIGSARTETTAGFIYGEYIGIDLPSSVSSNGYSFTCENSLISSWYLCATGSLSTQWTILDQRSNVFSNTKFYSFTYQTVPTTPYMYFRLVVPAVNIGSSNASVSSLSILNQYGDRINQYMNTASTLTQTVADPNVFDNGYYTGSNAIANGYTGESITIQFPANNITVSQVSIVTSQTIGTLNFFGSNTSGNSWTLLGTQTDTRPVGTYSLTASSDISTSPASNTQYIMSRYTDASGVSSGGEFTANVSGSTYQGPWFQIECPIATPISTFSFYTANDDTNVPYAVLSAFMLMGSNDALTWTPMFTSTSNGTLYAAARYTFSTASTQSYRFIRFAVNQVNRAYGYIIISRFQLYDAYQNAILGTEPYSTVVRSLPSTFVFANAIPYTYYGLSFNQVGSTTDGTLKVTGINITTQAGDIPAVAASGQNRILNGKTFSGGVPIVSNSSLVGASVTYNTLPTFSSAI